MEDILDRLKLSIDSLEESIKSSIDRIKGGSGLPKNIIDRVFSYNDIIKAQRQSILELEIAVRANDLGTIGTLVLLINARSSLIADDARDILNALKEGTYGESKEDTFDA